MSDVRVVALHRHERLWLLQKLQQAICENDTDREMQNDIAEMLLSARRADEFGGLNDA